MANTILCSYAQSTSCLHKADLPPLIDTYAKLEFHAHKPLEQKANLANILILELRLDDVSCSFEWNKPFDLLYDLENVKGRVPLGTKLRTYLRHFSLAPLIQQLSQISA